MILACRVLCTAFVILVNFINDSKESKLDTHVNLIIDIQNFYTAGSVYIVLDGKHGDFAVDTLLFNLLKKFSSRKILSQAMRHSEFFANYKKLYTKNKRQLIVLLLTDDETLKIFELFTKVHNLSMHAWFIVFWAEPGTTLHDYCEKPKRNRFHLNFDVRMLVKCLGNPEIREWYALEPKAEVRVNELMEWLPERGLTQKTKLNFYQRRRDFRGKLLKVSTVKELDDAVSTPNKIEDRIEMMMTEMMLYMNFNVSFQQPIPNYGLFNHTEHKWNGMLGNLSRGEIDMCFTDITMTQQRHQYFDYTWPLFMTPNVLYIKKVGKSAVKWNAYSKAFDYKIWISILILMTIASIAVTIIKAKVKLAYYNKNNFLENQLYIWGIFCQQGLPAFPDSSPLRIAYVSLFFCAIAITAAFSGSIVSNLTNLAIVLPFTSFKEFVSLGTYKLSVMRNSFDHEYFTYNEDPIVAKMNKMMVRDKDLPANNVEGLQQICRVKAAFYTNEAMKSKVARSIPCKITGVLTGGNRFMALPLSKNNPLTSFVNHHIRRYEDYGLMKRTKNYYMEMNAYTRKTYDPVGISEITPLLTILIFGVVISTFVLLLEWFSCGVKYMFNNYINKEITTYDSRIKIEY